MKKQLFWQTDTIQLNMCHISSKTIYFYLFFFQKMIKMSPNQELLIDEPKVVTGYQNRFILCPHLHPLLPLSMLGMKMMHHWLIHLLHPHPRPLLKTQVFPPILKQANPGYHAYLRSSPVKTSPPMPTTIIIQDLLIFTIR